NVLVGVDGVARLADYGLAKRLDASVSASCTPAFAAPEQLAGEEEASGVRVDVYSVGATLFALLTGKPPIPGRVDVFAFGRATGSRRPEGALLRGLWRDAGGRFQSAGEFARSSGGAGGASGPPPPPPPPEGGGAGGGVPPPPREGGGAGGGGATTA